MRIEWHPEAVDDLRRLGMPVQRRIKKVLDGLKGLDDPRKKLVAYSGSMKDYWKLRIGDHRLICQMRDSEFGLVLVICIAHRSVAYEQRHRKTIEDRSG